MNATPQKRSCAGSCLLFGGLALVVFVLPAVVLMLIADSSYLRSPNPAGMLLRIELDPVESPLDRFTVESVSGDAPAVIIGQPASGPHELRFLRVAFPSGERQVLDSWTPTTSPPMFDFDGDGQVDTIRTGDQELELGQVQVLSGRDGSVLYEDLDDELEYESDWRGFPLGDLDGDGTSELGLLFPRMDRASYDLHPAAAFMDVHSWLTIISSAH